MGRFTRRTSKFQVGRARRKAEGELDPTELNFCEAFKTANGVTADEMKALDKKAKGAMPRFVTASNRVQRFADLKSRVAEHRSNIDDITPIAFARGANKMMVFLWLVAATATGGMDVALSSYLIGILGSTDTARMVFVGTVGLACFTYAVSHMAGDALRDWADTPTTEDGAKPGFGRKALIAGGFLVVYVGFLILALVSEGVEMGRYVISFLPLLAGVAVQYTKPDWAAGQWIGLNLRLVGCSGQAKLAARLMTRSVKRFDKVWVSTRTFWLAYRSQVRMVHGRWGTKWVEADATQLADDYRIIHGLHVLPSGADVDALYADYIDLASPTSGRAYKPYIDLVSSNGRVN